MEVQICTNCLHHSACSFMSNMSGLNRLDCSMHEVKPHLVAEKPIEKIYKTEKIKDLCSICDFKDNCSLKTEDQFKFQCDDYQ